MTKDIKSHGAEVQRMRERAENESRKLRGFGVTAPFMVYCAEPTEYDNNVNVVYARYDGGDLDGTEEAFLDDFSDMRRYDEDGSVDSIMSMLNRVDDIHPEYAVYHILDDQVSRIKRPNLDRHFPYGLRKFDNPEDAFNVMCGEYGESTEGLGTGYVHILNGSEWQKMVFERFCRLCVEHNAGNDECEQIYEDLDNEEVISEYFTDFNYFLYYDGSYWTSLMEMKDDNVTRPCQAQWELYIELWETFGLTMMWRIAKKFTEGITDYGELFDKLNEECMLPYTAQMDPLDTFLDLEEKYFPELFDNEG